MMATMTITLNLTNGYELRIEGFKNTHEEGKFFFELTQGKDVIEIPFAETEAFIDAFRFVVDWVGQVSYDEDRS